MTSFHKAIVEVMTVVFFKSLSANYQAGVAVQQHQWYSVEDEELFIHMVWNCM